MELYEAVKIIIKNFGSNILSERRFINALQDYYQFDVPAQKRIVASLVEDGQLLKLANCVDVKLEINRIADYEYKNRGYQTELTKNVLLSCAKGLGKTTIQSIGKIIIKSVENSVNNNLENRKRVEVSNRPKFYFQGIYGDKLDKIQKTMEEHPGALMDSSTQGDKVIYRVYWLAIGPDINGKVTSDNNFFDVKFSIREDMQGMLVSITNICEEPIDVDWRSFKINRCKTHIEGIVWALYNKSGVIMPGEIETKMIQPSIYKNGKVEKMFDLDKIKKKEFIYEVSFNVKCGKNRKRNYSYSVYTKLKIVI